MRTAKNRLIRGIATVYVEVVRGFLYHVSFSGSVSQCLGCWASLTEVPTSIYALTFFFRRLCHGGGAGRYPLGAFRPA